MLIYLTLPAQEGIWCVCSSAVQVSSSEALFETQKASRHSKRHHVVRLKVLDTGNVVAVDGAVSISLSPLYATVLKATFPRGTKSTQAWITSLKAQLCTIH
jgi:hypothetical protein